MSSLSEYFSTPGLVFMLIFRIMKEKMCISVPYQKVPEGISKKPQKTMTETNLHYKKAHNSRLSLPPKDAHFWGHRGSWLTSLRKLKVSHCRPVSRWCEQGALMVCLQLVMQFIWIEKEANQNSAASESILTTFIFIEVFYLLVWLFICFCIS